MKELKNPKHEASAKAISEAINNGDSLAYTSAREASGMRSMERNDLLEFRDRVRYLVNQKKDGE